MSWYFYFGILTYFNKNKYQNSELTLFKVKLKIFNILITTPHDTILYRDHLFFLSFKRNDCINRFWWKIIFLQVRHFLDFTPDGPLCHVLSIMHQFKHEQGWRRFDFSSPSRKVSLNIWLSKISTIRKWTSITSQFQVFSLSNIIDSKIWKYCIV